MACWEREDGCSSNPSHRLFPLLKVFGGKRLSTITDADVNGYQLLRLKQVGSRTINLETKVLRWARIADGYKPLPENKQGPGRALQPEQEKRLFETARNRVSKMPITLLW